MSMDIEALRTGWANDLDHLTWKDGPIEIIGADPDRTWIWSDLHLSDRGALEAFDRPFRNIHAMNRELLANWRRSVRPSDTIICLGDVAHPDALADRRLMLDLRELGGERILILGNHDLDRTALAGAGFGAPLRCANGPAAGPVTTAAGIPRAPSTSRPPARGRRADAAARQPAVERLATAATPPRRARQGTPPVAAGKRLTTAAALT